MAKITEKIAALPHDGHFFSLEFFPPKTEAGQNNLQARLSRMARALRPTFVNVTWGAGGTTAGRSLELAELCQQQLGLTTCLHLTCTNMNPALIDKALHACKEIGVRNILALRGDPPRRYEYGLDDDSTEKISEEDELKWAADLVRYVRNNYGDYFCIGVAGYPEGHSDESNPAPESQSVEKDLPYLVEKVKAGADFIMTQLFYDGDAYVSYEKRLREYDPEVLGKILVIPGLMPIHNFAALKRVTKLSHASLPDDLVKRLERHRSDDEEIKRIGVDVLSEIVERVKKLPSPTPRGFHFYTLNLEKSVSCIVERCKLIPPLSAQDFLDGDPFDDATDSNVDGHDQPKLSISNQLDIPSQVRARRPSSPHNHNADGGSSYSTSPASRATTLAITHGVGSLGREATWDDFPNGRFGDSRSPAFGEIDGYGPSIHMSPASARMRWGSPSSMQDLQNLFLKYIRGELDMLPWSEGAVNAETRVIEPELRALLDRGWLSVASQPAVDAADSTDPTFGWGPRGGFVFQKAFVEMFVPRDDWLKRLRPRLQAARDAAGGPQVSWYASPCSLPSCRGVPALGGDADVNVSPEYEQSDGLGAPGAAVGDGTPHTSGSSAAANSVTWGVFPGKEIATSTIIEEDSFKAWVEEAFNLWAEWERCYPLGNPTRHFLRQCREDAWLVNVIGHGFKRPAELWEILLSA